MRAESDQKTVTPARDSLTDIAHSDAMHDSSSDETLTDIIDQLRRRSFRAAFERRHASVPYRTVVESVRLVRTTSS